jgi:hypothetical protein
MDGNSLIMNRNKTAKFLLCENPIAEKSDGRLFILHTQDPVILAELWHYEGLTDRELIEKQNELGPTNAKLEYMDEVVLFSSIMMFRGEKFSQLPGQEQADKLAGVMRRMADWYKAYLIWEDSQDYE